MRTVIWTLALAAAFPLVGCTSLSPFNPSNSAAGQPAASTTQTTAAQDGLIVFRGLINAKNYAGLGFNSPEDARRASLGEPMSVFLIRLDTLRNMTEETNLENLLVDVRRAFYPVEIDKRVATSLVVTQHPDGWRATDFGNGAIARAVTRYRVNQSDFLVHAAAFKVYFIGRKEEGTLTFTPIMDDQRFGFRAGETLSAERAVVALRQAAQEYNGLPQ